MNKKQPNSSLQLVNKPVEDVAVVMEMEGMVNTVVDGAVTIEGEEGIEMAGIEEDLTINEKLLKELKRKDSFYKIIVEKISFIEH